jgi:hypothetical protein
MVSITGSYFRISVMVPTIAKGWKLQVETYSDVLVGARRHYTAAPNTVSWQPVRSPVLPPFRADINFQLAEEEQDKTVSKAMEIG